MHLLRDGDVFREVEVVGRSGLGALGDQWVAVERRAGDQRRRAAAQLGELSRIGEVDSLADASYNFV